MPPAAISRSSTYLPKSCGNIARGHASAGLALTLVLSCGQAEQPIARVRLKQLASCPVLAERVDLQALGDFAASELTSESIATAARDHELRFPAATRAVSAVAGDAPRWFGVAERWSDPGVDLTLWPAATSCEVWPGASAATYPLATGGESLGASLRHRTLLVVGALIDADAAARALAVSLDDFSAAEVPGGLPYGVAHASVTEFGEVGLLVAGGDNAIGRGDPALAVPEDRAVVYDARRGRFDRSASIELSQRRSRHAAIVIASGETVLIGGAGEGGVVSTSLEAIAPSDRSVRLLGLTRLARARKDLQVLALSDGRWLVAGGTDAAGTPVASLEWLSADASSSFPSREGLRLSSSHAFVALPGGGALGVGLCDATLANCAQASDAELARKIAWIRNDAHIDALADLPLSAVAHPVLVAAADGAPFLFVSEAQDGPRRWLRFDPWRARFAVVPFVSADVPDADLAAPIALDGGLLIWLAHAGPAARAVVRGLRHDLRGVWTRDVAPLLLVDGAHLAPDRAPLGVGATGAEYVAATGLGLAGDARAVVTEARYGDVSIELSISGPALPRIWLGTTELGGSACPWPPGNAATLRVERRGEDALLARGAATSPCAVGPGHVELAVGAAAGGGEVRLRSLGIARTP